MKKVLVCLFAIISLSSVSVLAVKHPSGNYCIPIEDGFRVYTFKATRFVVTQQTCDNPVEQLVESEFYTMQDNKISAADPDSELGGRVGRCAAGWGVQHPIRANGLLSGCRIHVGSRICPDQHGRRHGPSFAGTRRDRPERPVHPGWLFQPVRQ